MKETKLLRDALDKYEIYTELIKTQPIDSDYEPMDFQRFFRYYLKLKDTEDKNG